MTLSSGARIGPYEITGPLGAGGMGEVFRARDTRLGREVAVKILPTLFVADPDRLRRFEQEARAAATLNHPNIVAVYDVGMDAQVPYVVSELLDGQTLRQALERGALPPRKAVDYGMQLAGGLAAAHDKAIVHRDLKPENVFITKDGRVKILDFGLAKLTETVTTDASRATMAQTDPGTVVGTAGYMSPEQLRGEPVDARSDVFSLGAVLYEMFTGARAFKGKTAVDTMSAILKEDPAEFPSGVHAAQPAVERIVRRCLEKSVGERFQSARDVTFALEALSTASGPKAELPEAPPAGSRRVGRVGAALAALAVVGAAMYGAGARFSARTADPPSLTQLTFRRGTVGGARYSPDGKTVVYAAAWEGEPYTMFSTRPGTPDSSPLSLPYAELLSMSSGGELALLMNPHHAAVFRMTGTLARASLSGGGVRELAEGCTSADWLPDGSDLAIVRRAEDTYRIEWPIGSERLRTPYHLADLRLSPDGRMLAFIAHVAGGDDGDVRVMERTGAPRTVSAGWASLEGLAWAPGGRELWLTGTRAGMIRGVWAVTLDGRERLLYRAPIRLHLEDVAPDGRVLLTATSLRSEIRFGSLRAKSERSLSWFDYATGITMSADAKVIAFVESGEGAGKKYGVFVRPTDGRPAFRLADGGFAVMSPDGNEVIIGGSDPTDVNMRVMPSGPGLSRAFALKSLERGLDVAWFPDSRHAVIVGNEAGHGVRSYDVDTHSGRLTPLTPEGIAGTQVSPDGKWLAVSDGQRQGLFDLHAHAFTALSKKTGDDVAGWSADSRAVYVFRSTERDASLGRVDIATGARTELGVLQTSDPAGVIGVGNVTVAPDGDHYVYRYFRELSQLFEITLR